MSYMGNAAAKVDFSRSIWVNTLDSCSFSSQTISERIKFQWSYFYILPIRFILIRFTSGNEYGYNIIRMTLVIFNSPIYIFCLCRFNNQKGTFSESLFKMACTVFVLPVPLIPDSKVCLDSKFTGEFISNFCFRTSIQ